ncbi:hypothetical protein LTR94_023533 [Friedmanniomyces endolithicus]|nr:hypothetical protein LTR94_023533 [Friedmanniomyces endolithicus]
MALPREVGSQPASMAAVTALRTASTLTRCFSTSGRPLGRKGGGNWMMASRLKSTWRRETAIPSHTAPPTGRG